MEDLKQSVRIAEQYLTILIPAAKSVLVEEVESTDDDGWLLTLSFLREADSPLGQFAPQRSYKQFHVVDGTVRSMKIRGLAGA